MIFYQIPRPVQILMVLLLVGCGTALGQSLEPRGLSLQGFYGPFLVDSLAQVDEVLPLGGVALGHPILRSQVEYGAAMAKAHGMDYQRFHLSFRNPLGRGPLVAHWLLGLHLDHYSSRATRLHEPTTKWASGWHLGAGWRATLTERLSFRNDYRYGLSPGRQLHALLGLEYFFGSINGP